VPSGAASEAPPQLATTEHRRKTPRGLANGVRGPISHTEPSAFEAPGASGGR
jgi:hypothetical protein